MAKRVPTQSGVQQVAVSPAARPVNTYSPVNLDPRAIEGLIDLAPLSASVASVVGHYSQSQKVKGYVEGQDALQTFAAANPALVELGGTDAGRDEVRKRLRQAVANGEIPESANPILYELWDQVTMQHQVTKLEKAVRLEMDAMTQVTVNGERVTPKSYEQVRAEKMEELGITQSPGYSSVFGQRAFAAGLAQMDSTIQREVAGAVAENTRRATRDGVRQGAQQLFSDLASKPVWGPEDYETVSLFDKAHVDGVANVKALMVDALLSQANTLAATDPDAALDLLNNAGDISFGSTSLREDASLYDGKNSYQEVLSDTLLRLERASDLKFSRKTREEDEKWREDNIAFEKLMGSQTYELLQQGMTYGQIRETLQEQVLTQFGDNGARLVDDMHAYLDKVEARGEVSDPTTLRNINNLIQSGDAYAAQELLLATRDSLSPRDLAALSNDISSTIQEVENLDADPPWRRAAKRLEGQYAVPAELTDEQSRNRSILFQDDLNELQQGYLERRRENPNDPQGNRTWLEAETEKIVQRDRDRQLRQQERARTEQQALTEKFRRFDPTASSDINRLAKDGLISHKERRELEAANARAQAELAQRYQSREYQETLTAWDNKILSYSIAFPQIVELVGDVTDASTGQILPSPNTVDLVNQVHDYIRGEYTKRITEIHATAEPSQFPLLESQALQEIAKEVDAVLGGGATTPKVEFKEPTKMESAKAIVEAESFANSFAPGAEPKKPEQVSDIMWASYTQAVQSGDWKDFEKHRGLAADQALAVLPSVPKEQRGQVAVDSLSLYGIPYQQVLEGEVELSRDIPPIRLYQERSGTRRGITMRTNGIKPDRNFTGLPQLITDRTGSVDTYQQKEAAARSLQQAKAYLGQWYSDNPGKTPPAEVRLLQAQINGVEERIGRLRVPMGQATFNPFAVRMFNSESELSTLRKDSASWAALLSSSHFTTPIKPGSEEETAFIQAQKAAIRRARR